MNNTLLWLEIKRVLILSVSEIYKDTIIEIEFDLERFEMILTSGFNRLNLPNGCSVKTKDGSSITVSLIRSKRKF
jgi:hypothetical protein